MKRKSISLLLALLICFVLAPSARAEFKETDWEFFKKIEGPQPLNSEYAFFQVDAEIYDGCQYGLQGLRVVNSERREIPYEVVTKEKTETRKEFPAKILNNSYLPGQYNSFVIDTGEEPPEINEIAILTKSKNFTRRASIEGGDNQTDWNVLNGEAYIFDFSRDIKSQHLHIEFPPSNFRYLRVRVFDDGSGLLELSGATIFRVTKEKARMEQWPLTIIERRENQENKTTEIILDPGYRGIPIQEVELGVSDRNYQRNVEVQSSEDRQKWVSLGSGVIYNYDLPAFKKTDNRVSFRENTGGRYFKVIVQNYDDRPLDIKSVVGSGLVRRVIFPVDEGSHYLVYFGGSKVQPPLYDLSHRIPYIETERLPRLTLLSRQPNPTYIAKPTRPWSEEHAYLLWVIMVVVILFLGALILNLMRKTPPASLQE
jgi:hypothetical protein